jgi:hypothetical protein
VKQHNSLIDKKLFDLLTDQNTTNNNEINNETLLTGKLKTQKIKFVKIDEMLNLFCILYFDLRNCDCIVFV